MTKEVEINGRRLRMAYNLRTLFVYEEIAGKPYTGLVSIENYLLMYAMLIANNKDLDMEFEELIDACDKDMGLFATFTEVIEEQARRVRAFADDKKKAAAR